MGIVLRLEHQVQRVEHRPFEVPVIAIRLEIEALGIAEHLSKRARDLLLSLGLNADVDGHGSLSSDILELERDQ